MPITINGSGQVLPHVLSNTQPWADSTTKVATTEFVWQHMGGARGLIGINSNITIDPSTQGYFFPVWTNDITVTLPNPAAVSQKTYTFYAHQAFTLATPSGVFIHHPLLQYTLPSSLQIPLGSILSVTSDSVNWIVTASNIPPQFYQSIGPGQTWQNVTSSRAVGTTYYNTTGKPIAVYVIANSSSDNSVHLYVDGLEIGGAVHGNYSATQSSATGIVPPGARYSVTVGLSSIRLWAELR